MIAKKCEEMACSSFLIVEQDPPELPRSEWRRRGLSGWKFGLDEQCGNIARGNGWLVLAVHRLSWDGIRSKVVVCALGRPRSKIRRARCRRWQETGEKEGEGGRGKLAGEEAI